MPEINYRLSELRENGILGINVVDSLLPTLVPQLARGEVAVKCIERRPGK
jgi:hypothetical protein